MLSGDNSVPPEGELWHTYLSSKFMKNDTISFPNNVQLLKKHLIKYVGDVKFKECNNMGEILETILVFVKRNYQDVLTK